MKVFYGVLWVRVFWDCFLEGKEKIVYFSAVCADPELVGVTRAVAGSQRILHLVTDPYKVLGLCTSGYKEDAKDGILKR